tara:strand:- start:1037 stop:2173 length:1137 start_codon:yes stop_codon:yes gene_type:complete
MATITKTIGTNSRDYSTISAWEADLSDASIYSDGDDAVGEIYADSTFTGNTVTIDGGTSIGGSAGQDLNSVKLTVAAGNRHDGTAESGALLKPTANSGHNVGIIAIERDNFTLEWLDISLDSLDSANTNQAIRMNSGVGNLTIRNMLIHDKGGNPGSNGPFGIVSGQSATTSTNWYFLNNIFYSFIETSDDSAGAIIIRAFTGNLYIYNNTVYKIKSHGGSKDAIGFRFGDGTHVQANIKNNIVAGLDEGDIAAAYWMDEVPNSNRVLNSATNLSDDTSDAAKDAEDFDVNKNDSTALIGKTLAQIAFVSTTAGSEDLHITEDSVCVDAGTDVGTTGGVQTDINGRDRDAQGDTWDIGAHEFVADSDDSAGTFMIFTD